jgi:hypothetical protein
MKPFLRVLSGLILFPAVFTAQVNLDFEASAPGAYTASNSINGWTLSSGTTISCNTVTWVPGSPEFSIVSTPFSVPGPFSVAGTLPASPLGGSHVARLEGASGNISSTRLTCDYPVNVTNSLLKYAIAGGVESCGPQTSCCMQALIDVRVKDQNGTILCSSASLAPTYTCSSNLNYSAYANGHILWANWQVMTLDLSPWNGSVVTLEFISSDCKASGHNATLFVDVTSSPQPDVIYFCPGATQAVITPAPLYWSYTLIGPGNTFSTQTMQSHFVIQNPVSHSVYTLIAQPPLSDMCPPPLHKTYTLIATTASVTAITTNSVCYGASNGSSTVSLNISHGGYTYTWHNSNQVVVGTTPAVANLPAGAYTVTVTGVGSNSTCGTASATTMVNTAPPATTNFLKPLCNIDPTLCVTGNNVQWYNGNTPIPALQGGTAACYSISGQAGGSILRAGFVSTAGCRDSVVYTLTSVAPGSVSITHTNLICPGASNGSVIVTMFPAPGSPTGSNVFSLTATGNTPPYVSGLGPTSSATFHPTGLPEGSYSLTASDGLCTYSQSLSVTTHHFDYSISIPQNTICQGTVLQASVDFTAPVSQSYSYSWSPGTYLLNPASNPVVIIPALSTGTTVSLVYSVTATHSLSGCAITKTLGVTMINPPTPTIFPIPLLCQDALSSHTISVSPAGGIFSSSSPAVDPISGIIQGLQGSVGHNTVIYTWPMGSACSATTMSSFTINAPPPLSVSGNTALCAGESATLVASGASSYSWNATPGTPSLHLNPATTSIYTVTGTDPQTNCAGRQTVTVQVQAFPVLTLNGLTSLCSGETTLLSAGGASSYSWSNGSLSSSISVSPVSNTHYTLQGTSAPIACTSTTIIAIQVSACTGTGHDPLLEGSAGIYPNPAGDVCFIETRQGAAFSVFDGLGRLLMEGETDQARYELNISRLNHGVYFITVTQGRETKILKLVKSN